MKIYKKSWEEFLDWFKEATEAAWAALPDVSVQDTYKKSRVLGPVWQKETRWLGGFSEDEITAVEQKYSLTFPADYRQFLAKLGAPDRPMFGPSWQEGQLVGVEIPSFYNWLTEDDEAIRAALQWPLEGLLIDVEDNDLWLDGWGAKPDNEVETAEHLAQLVADAPPLIPIFGHRYLLDYPNNGRNPVLSVYQSDIIVYGTNLQSYLLREMASLLNLPMEKDNLEMVEIYYAKNVAAIPFWGDIVLYEGDGG
jgi:hypothetical protein